MSLRRLLETPMQRSLSRLATRLEADLALSEAIESEALVVRVDADGYVPGRLMVTNERTRWAWLDDPATVQEVPHDDLIALQRLDDNDLLRVELDALALDADAPVGVRREPMLMPRSTAGALERHLSLSA